MMSLLCRTTPESLFTPGVGIQWRRSAGCPALGPGRKLFRVIPFAVALFAFAIQNADAADASVQYAGVNLPTAAFGSETVPGTYGKDYIYPQPSTVDYFADKGMNIVRLPVRWERLQ